MGGGCTGAARLFHRGLLRNGAVASAAEHFAHLHVRTLRIADSYSYADCNSFTLSVPHGYAHAPTDASAASDRTPSHHTGITSTFAAIYSSASP